MLRLMLGLAIVIGSVAMIALGLIPFLVMRNTIADAGKDAGGLNEDVSRKEYIQKVMYPNEDVYVESRGGDTFYVRNHDGEFLVSLRVRENGSYEEKIQPIR